MRTDTVAVAALTAVTALIALPATAGGKGNLGEVHQDFSRDPGWEGARNRLPATFPPRVRQRFGWSPTNHAGEAPGEVGGHIQSSTRPAHYAKAIERRTLETPLSFSGSLALLEARAISGWHTMAEVNVGFFRGEGQGWRPKDFLGFRLVGSNEPDGALIEVHYGTGTGAAGGKFLERTGLEAGVVEGMDHGRMVASRPGPPATPSSAPTTRRGAAAGGRSS